MSTIAVMDIGKSNAKLSLVDGLRGEQLSSVTAEFQAIDQDPYPQLNTTAIWHWFLAELAQAQKFSNISHLCVTAHGATVALLGETDLAMPVLDYEYSGPDACEDQYSKLRDPFSETYSPALPGGLNIGKQLFWQRDRFKQQFSRTKQVVPYAQFWTWKLTGVALNEVSTLGSHSDLWFPVARTFSRLAVKQGFADLFPPLRKADEIIGTPLQHVCNATGVSPDCKVIAGIHDSNASLMPHLKLRNKPFTVMSTGTWVIIFAVGSPLQRLDPSRGCTANVNIYSDPVACARFMGGREFAHLAGNSTGCSVEDLSSVMAREVLALPAFADVGGPFPQDQGRVVVGENHQGKLTDLAPAHRFALATIYCALLSDVSLDLSGSLGDVIVEGAFARNELLLQCLAVFRSGQKILGSSDSTGTTMGTAMLVTDNINPPRLKSPPDLPPSVRTRLLAYRTLWYQRVNQAGNT